MKRGFFLLVLAAIAGAETVDPATMKEWRERILTTLRVPESPPALNPVVWSRFAPEPGIIAERITYGTQFGLRIPVILYRPQKPSGKSPALIVVNGHGGDKYSWYAQYSGVLYARAGAVVLTYDPLGEGERNPDRKSGTRAHDKLEPLRSIAMYTAGQMISDVQQAISYLATRPEVNPSRIGAMGYSMGSVVLLIAGAIEPRLNTVVLVGGGNMDGPGQYWDSVKPLCTGFPYQALSFLGDRPAALYAMQALRGPTLVYNGTADTIVNVTVAGESFMNELARRTAALVGSRGTLFETGFVPGASHRPFFVTRPVAQWLERRLDFATWSPDLIDRMPTTQITDWSRATGVALDPLYATEEREGGTPALGTRVPGLTREQLSVIPEDRWPQESMKMTIDRWEQAVRLRINKDSR